MIHVPLVVKRIQYKHGMGSRRCGSLCEGDRLAGALTTGSGQQEATLRKSFAGSGNSLNLLLL